MKVIDEADGMIADRRRFIVPGQTIKYEVIAKVENSDSAQALLRVMI